MRKTGLVSDAFATAINAQEPWRLDLFLDRSRDD
jgi:hypothetical protein